MRIEEGIKRLGCRKTPADARDFVLRAPRRASSPVVNLPLPGKLDYTAEMLSRVEDQGDEPSCVGFAASAMKEWQERREWGADIDLSARFIYEEAREIDVFGDEKGATDLRSAMKVLRKKGVCTEQSWPYAGQPRDNVYEEAEKYRIAGYASIPQSNVDRKFILLRRGPFVTGITVFDSWFDLEIEETGLIQMPCGGDTDRGGHAICVVGYDDDEECFKFRNSWGPDWGDKGYGFIPYGYMEKYSWDGWTSVDVKVPDTLLEVREIAEETVRELLEELRSMPLPAPFTEIVIRVGTGEVMQVLSGEGIWYDPR